MFDRITFDSQIMGGRVHTWTRIPLSVIVGQIAHAASFDEILEGYPIWKEMTFNRRFEYAAWLTEEEIHIVRIQVQKRK